MMFVEILGSAPNGDGIFFLDGPLKGGSLTFQALLCGAIKGSM
jgi:hypothetical protein